MVDGLLYNEFVLDVRVCLVYLIIHRRDFLFHHTLCKIPVPRADLEMEQGRRSARRAGTCSVGSLVALFAVSTC